MTTQAEIEANRKNAQKSTGPKSRQGKDTVSQNAVKHGLCANKHVIRSESQEEFDEFRQNMIADLEPVGAMEKMLTDRIVSLSWRLKRAEQFQNLAIESLIEFNLNDGWYKGNSARREADKGNLELIIGFAINRDFEEGRTLDLLLMYERRIESSLYKATSELRKMQRIRKNKQSQFDCAEFSGLRSAAGVASLESCAAEQSQIDVMDETGRGIESSGEGHPHPDKLHRDEDATQYRLIDDGFPDEQSQIRFNHSQITRNTNLINKANSDSFKSTNHNEAIGS